MKLNKDLIDAIMMMSFIILVLVGTTDFENTMTKNIVMGAFGITAVTMIVLRALQFKLAASSPKKRNDD